MRNLLSAVFKNRADSGSRVYCTYFDSHYLAQGIAMLRSLQRFDPGAPIYVLPFDGLCGRVLQDLFGQTIRIVPQAALHARFSALRKLKDGRTQWASYATHKPALARFVLEQRPRPSSVTFIDADTWFFADPKALHDEIGEASIALSPHRFAPETAHLAVHGEFNAGCVYWRADRTGRRCVADWAADCLKWCDEQLPGDGRSMNQGYLNRWPGRYSGVHIIKHPGVNLAPWNLDVHRLARDSEGVTVDGLPLIFYHFSGLIRDAESQWYSFYPHSNRLAEFAQEALYGPYLRAVENERRLLVATYGVEGIGSVRAIAIGPQAVRFYPSVKAD